MRRGRWPIWFRSPQITGWSSSSLRTERPGGVVVLRPPNLIRDSARVYGLLLWLYPARFRRAFAGDMRNVFERWLEDEAARDGWRGVLRVWRTTLAEFIPTLFRECGDALTAAHAGQAAAGMLRSLPRLLVASPLPAGVYVALLRAAS